MGPWFMCLRAASREVAVKTLEEIPAGLLGEVRLGCCCRRLGDCAKNRAMMPT